jgi:hypothetical protein
MAYTLPNVAPVPTPTPTVQGNYLYGSYPAYQINPSTYNYPTDFVGPTKPSPTSGQVAGLSTSNTEVGGAYPTAQPKPTGTLSGTTQQSDPFAGQQGAATDANAAEIASLNTEFDRLSALANDQLGYLQTEYQNANSNLENQKTGLLSQVNNQIGDVNTSRDQSIAEAGDIARSTQGKNRNMLRGLGILNSSAAGDVLSRPLEEFDKQRANFVSAAQGQVNKLNDFLNQKTSELTLAAKEISDNYLNLVSQIQTDLRFSDRERSDAIRSANAALSQRMADIKNAQAQYQMQTEAQKQTLASQMAQLQSYSAPTVDQTGFSNTLVNPGATQNKTQAVNIYSDKDKLSSLT